MRTTEEFTEVLSRTEQIRRLTAEIMDLTSNDATFGERMSDERNNMHMILRCTRELSASLLQAAYDQDLLQWDLKV